MVSDRIGTEVSAARAAGLLRPVPQEGRPRLIMVSNRAPIEHAFDEQGRLVRQHSGGGVATALASCGGGWPLTLIAAARGAADRQVAETGRPVKLGAGRRLRLVAPPEAAYDLHYNTFCNPMLWFLQHGLWDLLERPDAQEELMRAWQRGYLPVNQAFAESVVEELEEEDTPAWVLLHDYHLYAAPLFIRNLRANAVLQHFVHIPWPEPEAWQRLPRPIVASICEGLLANDSVAFQTERSAQNFLLTCDAFVPDVRLLPDGDAIDHAGRRTRVWHNPVSVDIWDLRAQLFTQEAEEHREKLSAALGERTIVRVDRLDPTKNTAAGFRAFGRLLERHPEWRGKVRFLAFLVPSRTTVPEYRAYAAEVFAAVDAVNARFGSADWQPITVFHEHNRLQALVAMSLYDVLLVNPLVDGMNLVSKEGPVVNGREGVLVLSSNAGSFAELRHGALAVEPHDVDGTADALHRALAMPARERAERAQLLRRAIIRHDLPRWMRLLLEEFERLPAGPSVARTDGSFAARA